MGPELTFINPGGVVCVGDGMQVRADHVMSSPSLVSPLVTKLRKPAPMVTPPRLLPAAQIAGVSRAPLQIFA